MMENEMELPEGWRMVVLGDYCDKISLNGIKIKQRDYLPNGKFPVVDQGQELIGGYFDNPSLVVPNEPPYIIFGDHTKVMKFINFKFIAGADGVKVLKPKAKFDPKFFFYLIHTVNIPNKGYARHFQFLDKAEIPLPTLPEQERIVAKIEQLFSELEKGKEQILLAQQQLKTYRQAVLKWAFEGRLSDDFREVNTNLKSAKEIVQLENKRAGEKVRQHKWTPLDLDSMSQLPKSWQWERLGAHAFVTKLAGFEFTKYVQYSDDGEIPVIRAQNVAKASFVPRNFLFVPRKIMEQLPRSRVFGGEILMVFVGAGLGNVGIVPQGQEYFLGPNVAKIAVNSNYDNKFVFYFLSSSGGFANVNEKSKATAQGSISMGNIREVAIPLLSIEEQHRIVQEIESRLSVCDAMEATLQASLAQAEQLRQSILKRAFEGRLV